MGKDVTVPMPCWLRTVEIAELKFDADWVVQSACNTASSEGVGAEPLSGLARAFVYAGGKSLVVSHWDVCDDATAKLMSNLFETSKNKPGFSHGEMMRQATVSPLDAATTDEDAHLQPSRLRSAVRSRQSWCAPVGLAPAGRRACSRRL